MGQLLSQNCNNNTNEERLLTDCDEGRYHIVASLLKHHSVNVNCIDAFTGDTPLLKAVRHAVFVFQGNLPIVECLLRHGADVNAIDRGKSTPLHWACVYHHGELVRLLVHYGANVHVRDALGTNTPCTRHTIAYRLLNSSYKHVTPIRTMSIVLDSIWPID